MVADRIGTCELCVYVCFYEHITILDKASQKNKALTKFTLPLTFRREWRSWGRWKLL